MGWLGEGAVVAGCGWSVRMAAVGWRVVGVLVVCPLGLIGEKNIWMLVWDRRRRVLDGKAGRLSGGIGSCVALLCFIVMGMLMMS